MTGRRVAISLLILLLLTAGALGYVTATERGLRWGFHALAWAVPGTLEAEAVDGRLIGPIDLRGLVYRRDGTAVRIGRLHIDWRPARLLRGQLHIRVVEADATTVRLPQPTQPPPGDGPIALPDIRLPLTVRVERASAAGLEVNRGGESLLAVDEVALAAHTGPLNIVIDHLRVRAADYAAELTGELRPRGDYPLDVRLSWQVDVPQWAPAQGAGRVEGDLAELRVHQQVTAPIAVTLEGQLFELLGTPRWQAEVSAEPFAPADLRPAWPDWPVSGRVQASGDLTSVSGTAAIEATPPALGPLAAELRAQWAGDRVTVEALTADLRRPGTTVEAQGTWSIADGTGAVQGRWQDGRWPLTGEPQVVSREGEFDLEGRLEGYRYQYTLSASVGGPQLPEGRWQASGAGDARGLALRRVTGQVLDGTVRAQGELGWSPAPRWALEVQFDEINPGAWQATWPGRLTGEGRTEGRITPAGPEATVTLASLTGALREQPVQAQGHVAIAPGRWQLDGVRLQAGDSTVQASGRVAERWDLDWRVTVPDLAAWLPDGAGQLQGNGTVAGPRETPEIRVEATGRALHYRRYAAETVALNGTLDLDRRAPSQLAVDVAGLTVADRALGRLELRGEGTLADHRVALIQQGGESQSARLTVTGALNEDTWEGTLQALHWDHPQLGQWRLGEPVAVRAGPNAIQLPVTCLVADTSRVCASVSRDQAQWRGEWRAAALPLGLSEPWLPAALAVDGRLDSHGEWRYGPADGVQLTARAHARAGEVRYAPPDRTPLTVGIEDLAVDVAVTDAEATGELRLAFADGGRLQAKGRLENPFGPGDRPLAARASATLNSTDLLALLSPRAVWRQGQAEAALEVDGTWAAPRLSGHVRLVDAVTEIPRLGLTLESLTLEVRTAADGRLQLAGQVRSGGGTLRLEGTAALGGSERWDVRLSLNGERVQVANLPEATIWASPQLRVEITGRRVSIEGRVEIPVATLGAPQRRDVVAASADVEVVGGPGEPEAPPSPWTVDSRITLVLGDKVRVDAKGLKARLTGSLTVIDRPGEVTTGNGQLNIVDGTYEAYGQSLTLAEGRLSFTGGPIDNPGVALRATRRTGDVLAGVRVTGTLQDPRLALFSEPAMAEADALSYLLLGRPMNQATGGEGELLYNAATKLGLAGGERIAKRIGEVFGIEEVSVERQAATGEAALVLGTYLSPRLYVNYSVGLFEPTNIFHVRYQLGRRWTLEAESGPTSGADLIYTIER